MRLLTWRPFVWTFLLVLAGLVGPSYLVAEEVRRAPESAPSSMDAEDFVQVLDTVPDGDTWLALESDTGVNWHLRNEQGDLRFRDFGLGTDRLVLTSDGRLGIGTTSPGVDFELANADGSGSTSLRLSWGGSGWVLGHTPNGVFSFSKSGTGGQELTVRDRLDAQGPTLDVQGSVRGTQFIATSSRAVKTAFDTLSGGDLLARLVELPVSSWRYVWEDESSRHVGPVAEDFQRLFGLGDGETIASGDADGVLMAALQGLYELTQSRLDALEAENAALRKRIEELDSAAVRP